MALTLLVLAAWTALEYRPLAVAFESNALVNGAILGVLALGIAVQLVQAAALVPATRRGQGFRPSRAA